MVSTRFLGLLSTVFLVVGALAVGQALHLTVVTGQVTYSSPAFVLQFVVGLVCIALGYRARRPVAESYDLTSDDRERERDGEAGRSGGKSSGATAAASESAEFDPAMSPLGGAAPGDADREQGEDGGSERDESDRDEQRGKPSAHDPTADESFEPDSSTHDGRRRNGT